MVDKQFSELRLAALYDLFAPAERRRDFAFYLPLLMSAGSVLDVGCGTGALLHRARAAGHTGRLCGLDPAAGMLEVARSGGGDIEWIHGDLASAPVREREFDLVVMTGHAFQVLLTDDEIRGALAAIARALTDGGVFAFETRNPLTREWEDWHLRYSGEVTDAAGTVVRSECEVVTPLTDGLLSFTHTCTSPDWDRPEISRSTLRFLGAAELSGFLAGAGLAVTGQYGDWDRSPLTPDSPEIITLARRRPPGPGTAEPG
ncbi:class I SAM-dependent DNA methyltransferase [Streptomyces aidingensis]|uniref:Ubiquinone/menaquinone biosynthesis C-methylase UbiE n=1 Tax=Streptomyces aidingensis TaxID=910347 RepID=A0A1I1L509_9ACTN|nr:class I SAM-dependent methyltransferase [Streptomyces aidingensis]SFC68109.1 Ubiquinone/menaquinone biosynthesis C-methylase UbiE [Streptomyces aidingensis]